MKSKLIVLFFLISFNLYSIDMMFDQDIDTDIILTDKELLQKALKNKNQLLRKNAFLHDQLEISASLSKLSLGTSDLDSTATHLNNDKSYSTIPLSLFLKWEVATSSITQNGFYLDYSSVDFTTNDENGSLFLQETKKLISIGTDLNYYINDWMNLSTAFEMHQGHVIDIGLDDPVSDTLLGFRVVTIPTIKLGADFRISNLDKSVIDLYVYSIFGLGKQIGEFQKGFSLGYQVGTNYYYILNENIMFKAALNFEKQSFVVENVDFTGDVSQSSIRALVGLVFTL